MLPPTVPTWEMDWNKTARLELVTFSSIRTTGLLKCHTILNKKKQNQDGFVGNGITGAASSKSSTV